MTLPLQWYLQPPMTQCGGLQPHAFHAFFTRTVCQSSCGITRCASLWGYAASACPLVCMHAAPSSLPGKPQLRSPASVDAVTSGSGLAGPLPRDTRGPGYHFPVPRAQLCGVRCRPSTIASTVPPGAFIVESPLLLTTPDLFMCVISFVR